MMRLPGLIILLLLLSTAHVRAAVEPILRMDLDETSAVPGQPVTVLLTVLVPTWMLEPPVFPSFEVPNVLARVPSRGTSPTSERIGSDTWSGVTRSYRLSPMLPGRFRIPADMVTLTFADPDTRQPVRKELATPGFEIVGSVPPGAEDIDPFVAARSLSLDRTVEGDPGTLAAGDALILRTEAKVSGVSPMFLPELAPTPNLDGLSAYSQSPVLEETENRGIVSGSRTETVTIMAEFAGRYQIPAISLDWYNLDSGRVETIQLPPIDLSVSGPTASKAPLETDGSGVKKTVPWLLAAGLCGLLVVLRRRVLRSNRFRDCRDRFIASEAYAYWQLKRGLGARDLGRVTLSAATWQNRIERSHENVDWRSFDNALTKLGQARFGKEPHLGGSTERSQWQALGSAARAVRRALVLSGTTHRSGELPPLNPRI